jgi:hypothetical protein
MIARVLGLSLQYNLIGSYTPLRHKFTDRIRLNALVSRGEAAPGDHRVLCDAVI